MSRMGEGTCKGNQRVLQLHWFLLSAPAHQIGLCPQELQDARSLGQIPGHSSTCSMQGAWALG